MRGSPLGSFTSSDSLQHRFCNEQNSNPRSVKAHITARPGHEDTQGQSLWQASGPESRGFAIQTGGTPSPAAPAFTAANEPPSGRTALGPGTSRGHGGAPGKFLEWNGCCGRAQAWKESKQQLGGHGTQGQRGAFQTWPCPPPRESSCSWPGRC